MKLKHYKGQDIKFDSTDNSFYCDIARSKDLETLMKALDEYSFLRKIEDAPFIFNENGNDRFRFIGQFRTTAFFWHEKEKRIIISQQHSGKVFYKYDENAVDFHKSMEAKMKRIKELESEVKYCESQLKKIVINF